MPIFRIRDRCVFGLTRKLVIYCIVGVLVVPITSVVGVHPLAAENQNSNKPMINTLAKIALVAGVISLLPIEIANGQLQMTKMPRRIEEALINPNLREVLIKNTQPSPKSTSVPSVVTPRVAALPESPVYSNETSRFSAIAPKLDTPESTPVRLPTIEQIDTPPGIASRPAEQSRNDEVSDTPPAIRPQPSQPASPAASDQAEPDLGGNPELLKPLAPIKGQLRFRVTGVAAMIESQPADVLIEVYNPTSHAIGPVEVNVQVPEELTITRFDRDAWLDVERRIIAFKLDRIEPETIEKIGMKGVSDTAGQTSLNVALLSEEAMVAERSFKTQVFPQQVARQQNFGDSEPAATTRQ